MMDHVDDILASDLLERYVLGDVSHMEREKVEMLRIDHRIVREKLDELESTMEKVALGNAIKAPAGTRECIMKSINGQDTAAVQADPASTSPSSSNWWMYIAAASIAALSTWMLMRSQVKTHESTISEQEAEILDLRKSCDKLNEMYAYLNHGGTTPYLLDGTAFNKESQVIVYWNEDLQQSMLKVIELPGITADQTYQLWADVDGHMLSLGTFDAALAINDAIPVDYLDSASSLNITVEPEGGSEHPTIATLTASIAI